MRSFTTGKIWLVILFQRIITYLLASIFCYVTVPTGIRALRYFIEFPEEERMTYLLLPHIATGFIALIIGPWQFLPGLRKKYPALHRWVGKTYLISIGISSPLGLYMAMNSTNLLFRTGITGLALAWMITALLAYFTIRKILIQEHRDWMILNYLLTWAFVSFRLGVKHMMSVGYTPEETMIMAWLCWVPPLLIASLLIYVKRLKPLLKQHHLSSQQKYPVQTENLQASKASIQPL